MRALKIAACCVMLSLSLFPQSKPSPGKIQVPKYDKSAEAVFRGTVQEVRERFCPVSGSVGTHLVMRLDDGRLIEVHLATSRFVHRYDLSFKIGETLEVTGVEVTFEGVETIFARKIKRGTDEFAFRDNDGKPIW